MRKRLAPLAVIAIVVALCAWAVRPSPSLRANPASGVVVGLDLDESVDRVNQHFATLWQEQQLTPAETADELLVLRRLTLALLGTVPSLEEIRQFERDDQPQRLERWTLRLLNDPRFSDYFSERLARCLVGVENGEFIIYRRDRFVSWLNDQLRQNSPYHQMVQQMVRTDGLWTDSPASNFVTAAMANGDLDENKLAARSARAFLGQSMDCAQCHDHPHADWKQSQFEGIAAQFGQVEVGPLGVHEKSGKTFEVEDRMTLEMRSIDPAVPFHPEWLPSDGTPREKFAHWLTHAENRRFGRATANRIWGLMFGRAFISPVDDMPDPPSPDEPDLLDVLAEDFQAHDYDLRRLIQVIVASRPFRLASTHEADDEFEIAALEEAFALFPLTRLRPEQIIGSMLQAAWAQTIDQNSHLFVRFARFTKENDFVKSYGDLGDQELSDRSGTIPQALLRMNSDMTRDTVKSDAVSTSSRIATMCRTNEDVVELCYLTCLTRRATDDERHYFLTELGDASDGRSRGPIVEDIFWTLFNSPEFSWNH
jgi:hypothetical protein